MEDEENDEADKGLDEDANIEERTGLEETGINMIESCSSEEDEDEDDDEDGLSETSKRFGSKRCASFINDSIRSQETMAPLRRETHFGMT